MGKIVFAVLIAAIVWLLFFLKPRLRRERQSRAREVPPGAELKPIEQMVKCARCGVFLPVSESATRDGDSVCANAQSCTPSSR